MMKTQKNRRRFAGIAAMLTVPLCLTGVSASASQTIMGDVDGNGVVDAADSAALLADAAQYGASQTHSIPGDVLAMCDTNGDGCVDATDAANILEYAASVGAMQTTKSFEQFMEMQAHFFGAYYYRVGSGAEIGTDPLVFSTREEMLAYCVDPDAMPTTHYGHNSTDLSEILAHYTDDFFEEHSLILIQEELGSGSDWFEVNGVSVDEENRYTVDISLFEPMIGTCDEAEWYIFVETDKGADHASAIVTDIHMISLTWD